MEIFSSFVFLLEFSTGQFWLLLHARPCGEVKMKRDNFFLWYFNVLWFYLFIYFLKLNPSPFCHKHPKSMFHRSLGFLINGLKRKKKLIFNFWYPKRIFVTSQCSFAETERIFQIHYVIVIKS